MPQIPEARQDPPGAVARLRSRIDEVVDGFAMDCTEKGLEASLSAELTDAAEAFLDLTVDYFEALHPRVRAQGLNSQHAYARAVWYARFDFEGESVERKVEASLHPSPEPAMQLASGVLNQFCFEAVKLVRLGVSDPEADKILPYINPALLAEPYTEYMRQLKLDHDHERVDQAVAWARPHIDRLFGPNGVVQDMSAARPT